MVSEHKKMPLVAARDISAEQPKGYSKAKSLYHAWAALVNSISIGGKRNEETDV